MLADFLGRKGRSVFWTFGAFIAFLLFPKCIIPSRPVVTPIPTAPIPTAPIPTASIPTASIPTAPIPTAPIPTAALSSCELAGGYVVQEGETLKDLAHRWNKENNFREIVIETNRKHEEDDVFGYIDPDEPNAPDNIPAGFCVVNPFFELTQISDETNNSCNFLVDISNIDGNTIEDESLKVTGFIDDQDVVVEPTGTARTYRFLRDCQFLHRPIRPVIESDDYYSIFNFGVVVEKGDRLHFRLVRLRCLARGGYIVKGGDKLSILAETFSGERGYPVTIGEIISTTDTLYGDHPDVFRNRILNEDDIVEGWCIAKP